MCVNQRVLGGVIFVIMGFFRYFFGKNLRITNFKIFLRQKIIKN